MPRRNRHRRRWARVREFQRGAVRLHILHHAAEEEMGLLTIG
ncbi:hypothetical protein [Streptomyces aureus]